MSGIAAVFVSSLLLTAAEQTASASAQQSTAAPATTTSTASTTSTTTSQDATAPLPVSLDRIRKALNNTSTFTAPTLKFDASNLPVFTVHTEAVRMSLSSILDDGTSVPAYVRPPFDPTHYEFLQQVTPDAVKGCGRLTTAECLQMMASRFASGLTWQRATQARKPANVGAATQPDPETQRIRAQIQQELLDQQAAAAAAAAAAASAPPKPPSSSTSQPPQQP